MKLRNQLISRRPFATNYTSISVENWIERLATLNQELTSDVPSLKSLKASILQLNFEASSTGVNLAAYLLESPQISLPLAKGKLTANDLFEGDVARVREDLENINARITLAISPAIDPSADHQIQLTRRRLKRSLRNGPVVTWSPNDSQTLALETLPRVLPVGATKEVSIRVLTISRIWARVELLEDMNAELTQEFRIDSGTIMKLTRNKEFRGVVHGTTLQIAMDSQAPITVAISVVLDWATGKPQELELTGFVSSNETEVAEPDFS